MQIEGKVCIILHRECYSMAERYRDLRDVMRVEVRKKFKVVKPFVSQVKNCKFYLFRCLGVLQGLIEGIRGTKPRFRVLI